MRDKTVWYPLLGFIRVYQCPDEELKIGGSELVRKYIDAFLHKQMTFLIQVPYDWLLFGETSTQSIVDPGTFPCTYNA
jgi:hypothetical protein